MHTEFEITAHIRGLSHHDYPAPLTSIRKANLLLHIKSQPSLSVSLQHLGEKTGKYAP